MSLAETGMVAGAASGASRPVRFIGPDKEYWRIVVRGAVLLMVTLGLYRFWLATDIRRFLWANTEIDGEVAGIFRHRAGIAAGISCSRSR